MAGSVVRVLAVPFWRVPSESGDREGELVEEINEFSVGRETHVARSAARHRLPGSMRSDGGFGGIDLVDHDLVETEVGYERVFAIGGKPVQWGWGDSCLLSTTLDPPSCSVTVGSPNFPEESRGKRATEPPPY